MGIKNNSSKAPIAGALLFPYLHPRQQLGAYEEAKMRTPDVRDFVNKLKVKCGS